MNKNGSYSSRTNAKNARTALSVQRTSQQYYVDGNAVRKVNTSPEKKVQHRKASPKRKNKNALRIEKIVQLKTTLMNAKYVVTMVCALSVTCIMLMSYVGLQSDITNHISSIASLESDLYEMRLDNDELYTKIMSDVDLEEIKRIAINELGMRYADESQVITYSGEGSDYVRQYNDIPTQ